LEQKKKQLQKRTRIFDGTVAGNFLKFKRKSKSKIYWVQTNELRMASLKNIAAVCRTLMSSTENRIKKSENIRYLLLVNIFHV